MKVRRHFKAFGMVAGAALALALGLAGCAEQAGTVGNAPASPVAGKKVAYSILFRSYIEKVEVLPERSTFLCTYCLMMMSLRS